MDLHEATDQWADLLERTFLLREACTKLREDAEAATEVRGGTVASLRRVAGYVRVLEDGLRKAIDDVKTHHRRGEGLTGENWLKRMDDLLGPEGGR
jgi:hypothetical protein